MPPDLLIPVYLDSNALLDLLASIEGGFSVVEKITSQQLSASQSKLEANTTGNAEFGTPNFLSMLKLNLGFGLSGERGSSTENQNVSEREKYYTYGSLFYRLRQYLDEEGLIKRLDEQGVSIQQLELSDFVEIRGVLRPNPIVETMEIMIQMFDYFETSMAVSNTDRSSSGSGRGRNRQKKSTRTETDVLKDMAQGILDDIERGETRAFVIDTDYEQPPNNRCLRAVAVLFVDYLRDKAMYEVRDREFYLLGKVVRIVDDENTDRINLLRGAALSAFPDETFNDIFKGFANLPGFHLPEISRYIDGPAIEIIPVSIYV